MLTNIFSARHCAATVLTTQFLQCSNANMRVANKTRSIVFAAFITVHIHTVDTIIIWQNTCGRNLCSFQFFYCVANVLSQQAIDALVKEAATTKVFL